MREFRNITAISSLVCLVLLLSVPPLSHAETFGSSLLDYMEYWEYGGNWDEDEGPQYFADLIFPLYQPSARESVFFFEPRVSYADGEYLLNAGGGYRQLVSDNRWMLGTNMFYDFETEHSHYRLGGGIEAISAFAEFRANSYVGLSSERDTETSSTTTIKEKAVDGFDVEFGMPVPYYSRLKLYGGSYWYNFERFKNKYGWQVRAEYTPLPYVVVDGVVSHDTKTNVDWGMTVAFRVPIGGFMDEPVRSPFELDETMFPDSDVSDRLGVLVERHHEIIVETASQSGTVTVEVARRN